MNEPISRYIKEIAMELIRKTIKVVTGTYVGAALIILYVIIGICSILGAVLSIVLFIKFLLFFI